MSAGDGIRCPDCGDDTSVIETRQNPGSLRRRRRCLSSSCRGRLTTIEMPAPEYSKRDTTQLVAIPNRHAALVEVVPRALMQALRLVMQGHDTETAAPEEHW